LKRGVHLRAAFLFSFIRPPRALITTLAKGSLRAEWPVLPPNDNRIGPAYRDINFGLIDIDWRGPATSLTMQVCDVKGVPRLSQTVRMSDLRQATA